MIEEVAGAVKDLIRARRVGQFGVSEAAAGTIRLHALLHTHEKVGDQWQPKERRGPSDQQADGDVDTAAPDAGSSTGLAAGCASPVRTLTGCWVRAPAVVVGVTQYGVCCLSFLKPFVA